MVHNPIIKEKHKAEKYLVFAFILIGVLVRLTALGQYPGGVNQDEAYSAYEAYCLLQDGMDSWGYKFPVYLTAWGSGMNALQSYLMMPLIAVFDLKLWVLRLPQALLASACLPALYALLKRLFDKKTALIGLAFLAICPWHISMARWGLESNLAPGMVLLGFLFFVLGCERPKYYVLSGLFYGLSLYAYATIWPVLPFMIALHSGYAAYTGKLKWNRWLLGGSLLLLLLALPLLLFLAVNWGIIEEIRTPLISVPRILQMRSSDISLDHLYENVYRMVKTFLLQRDDMVWNASNEFGLYYHLSLPFIVVGAVTCLWDAYKSIRSRRFSGHVLVLVWLLCGAALGCVIDGNVNRLNYLHFPLIICAVLGIRGVCTWISKRIKCFPAVLAFVYTISFILFTGFYFTDFQQKIASWYDIGLEPAHAYAQSLTEEEICVSDTISYPKILFYGQIEPDTFRDTVLWSGEPSAFMSMRAVEGYRFGVDEASLKESVCLMKADEIGDNLPEGTQVKFFDCIAVTWPADQVKN